MKPHTQGTAPIMRASLKWDTHEHAFITDDVDTSVNSGDRLFQGLQFTEGADTAYSAITLIVPQDRLVEGATLTIGAGENAKIRAYFGSTSIGRSGWATGGEIHITQMDETTKAFSARFHYTIEDTMGQVEIDGSLSLSLADQLHTGTGRAHAKLTPALVPSVGDLDARTVNFKYLQDGRIRVLATQQVEDESQGIMMLFSQERARVYFLVNQMIYDMAEGKLEYQWDEQSKKLTALFDDYVVSYRGNRHSITNGSIDIVLG